ncbi:11813_t:CDS:2 [Entrophospora sp. SA101]|nr:11813_t:CDS:2 [Entrophospora sp. SA101]
MASRFERKRYHAELADSKGLLKNMYWINADTAQPKKFLKQPDGVERGLVGEIIKRFEIKGYKLIALQLLKPTEELIKEHYADLREKPFFPGLLQYILSGPVVGMVWEGKDAVKTGRRMLGETDPLKSAPGTIRGDYCIEVGRNMCHGSDSVENAEKEIALWFPNGVTQWNRNKVHSLFYEN